MDDVQRRDSVYNDINKIVKQIGELQVFPSLVWVYAWDIVVDQFDSNQWIDVHNDPYQDYAIPRGLDLKTIWDKFWEDADKNGFTLEYGAEIINESVIDWMIDNDFLVYLDPDSWLDEDDTIVVESQKEEV